MAIKLADTLTPMADFPAVMAEHTEFADGESLQEKLDNGSLGGGGASYKQLSQAEYDALTDDEKMDGREYRTYDTGHIYKLGVEYGKEPKTAQYGLVTNAQNFKIDITKNNAYWYGMFTFSFAYGIPCEISVVITDKVYYTITKGQNVVGAITYTQDGANYTFGIDFTAKIYGTQVVEMPTEFGVINSLTAESFAGDTDATFKGYDGITYTTLAELGLASSATIQNVMDALPVGGSCLIRTDAFDDTTQFMDVTWGYLKIEKTVNGLSKMEICDVVSDNKLYIGRQSSGKFNKWVALTTITSLSQLGLTADTTLNDVIAKLGVGQTATLTTTEFTNYQTLFPYEEEQDAYATVRIEKGYDVNGSRTIVKWVRKDASKIAYGGLNSANKVAWWNEYQVRNEIIHTSLTGNLSGITTVLDLVNALTTEYRSAKKPIRFVNGEINKTTLTDLPISYGLLEIVVAGWDVARVSLAQSTYGFKMMWYGYLNRITGEELFSTLTWSKTVPTFTDYKELGLASGCSIADIFNAMPTFSNFIYGAYASVTIPGTPTTDGVFEINKFGGDGNRGTITFTEAATNSLGYKRKWVGEFRANYEYFSQEGVIWHEVAYVDTFNGKEVKSVTIDLSADEFQHTGASTKWISLGNHISQTTKVIRVEGYYISPSDSTYPDYIAVGFGGSVAGQISADITGYIFNSVGSTSGKKGSGYAKIYYVE